MRFSSCITLALLLLGSAGCEEREALSGMTASDELPGPERAAAAAARVKPGLETDLTAKGLAFGSPVFIRAFKEEKELDLFVRNAATGKYDLFRTYRIAATSGGPGPKLAEGDGQVPEGFYYVSRRSMHPASRYHLAFNIGYPNAYDSFHKRTGSHIMIHGNEVSIGCLAMTDDKIEEIYTLADAALRNGQEFFRVHLFPFRMTDERMTAAAGDPNEAFWKNLKEGHDLFETNGSPPDVSVAEGRYAFK